jgi:hypothetical protein
VLFGVGATFLVVEHFQKKHINFHATEPPSQHTEIEHKVELAKRNNVESAPPDLKRIVTKDVSAITLPEPPELPNDEATPTAMSGMEGVMGMGLGNGLGKGGNGGGGGIPLFGAPDGSGLEGYLYDLKQTPDGKPSGMDPSRYHKVLMDFVNRNWDEAVLAAYYKSSSPLYVSQIMIPTMDAEAGPKAFGLDSEVQPKMWIVWYKGKVAAPATANYRFAGFCDDILLVRINGKPVLDGSISPVDTRLPQDRPWPCAWESWAGYGPPYGQLRQGPSIPFTKGEKVDIDIIIGEEPGGQFNAALFVFDVEKPILFDGAGQPLLPLFQLNSDSAVPDGEHPPYLPIPEPWQLLETTVR